ncbi:hypothetical protein FIBSPDRAFT_791261 [Athelia psychrophila]|uniref:AB hydrolase-1 domain-containing protein n=1 Tax=Athelia psychrophila TaxID=1759441 RepID=A0A166HI62_9AGAM|nr:hypothetical protein FIBSPDRAFT_791261 [Fibularhizoctonia sp. CBS 109695]
MSHFDPPSGPTPFISGNPRPLFPISPHPETQFPLPTLPSPARPAAFNERYTLSTHIVPAAYPRVAPDFPPLEPIQTGLGKEEKKRAWLDRTVELVRMHEEVRELGKDCGNAVLWNCVNRYSLSKKGDSAAGKGKGLTLFFAHANGFPKELWEPALQHLLTAYSGPEIHEIWTWEAVSHGDSYLLNKERLPGYCDWMDNSRDMMNFFVNYLPSAAKPSVLPVHLQRVPGAEAEARQISGYTERTLVVIGHSYGGATSAVLAAHCPAIFSSLVLVDPTIRQYVPGVGKTQRGYDMVRGALSRRDGWASKAEALRLFQASPFLAAWDPAVLSSYAEHGLIPDPASPHDGVKLKTPGAQEAMIFSAMRSSGEAWELLERIDERVALRWMMPGDMHAASQPIDGEEAMRAKVWRRPLNASNVRLHAGHLIPHENPKDFAFDLRSYLERQYGEDKSAKL